MEPRCSGKFLRDIGYPALFNIAYWEEFLKKIAILILIFTIICLLPLKKSIVFSEPKTMKVLPLLIEFSDQPHQRTVQEMDDYFFSNAEDVKSLRNYYLQITNNTCDFIPGKYRVGDWIKLPRTKKQYGQDASVENLAKDVFTILEKQNVDLSEYDNDGDKKIDYLLFIQSGDPIQASGSRIFWPHKYALFSKIGYGGIQAYEYNMISEIFMSNKLAPLQIICHEFYHYLGGWDLYSYTKQGNSHAVGPWDNMAENTYSKNFGLSGFSRSQLGWLKQEIIKENGTYEIDAIAGNGEKKLYRINIPGTKEYFLIENRFRIGIDAWWSGVPDEGIVIYHIDGNIPVTHRFNDGPPEIKHFAVWVEDPGAGVEKKDAAYSLEDNQITFSPESSPDSLDYDKLSQPVIIITDITNSGLKMKFNVEFRYTDPRLSVTPAKLDFGKVQKGFKKTMELKVTNVGVGTLRSTLTIDETWIIPNPSELTGNDSSVSIIVDTELLPYGKSKGRLTVDSNGGKLNIPISVEVVEKEGDLNQDNKIDKYDLVVLLEAFGSKKGEEKYNPVADFNQDGIVNLSDLVILLRNLD